MKERVYVIFSDTVMISLALLVIPILLLQNFLVLTPAQSIIISAIDWFIWTAFLLEFVLKLYLEKRKLNWLVTNSVDSTVSMLIIISPVLEYLSSLFAAAPILRLLRLPRLIRVAALTVKTKRAWQKIDLKVYVVFFLVVGTGFIASFFSSQFKHSALDITWFSVFVQIIGVFYAILISFFVIHVWGKFNAIGSEIAKEVNALRNVYIMTKQLTSAATIKTFSWRLLTYLDEIVRVIWQGTETKESLAAHYLKLVSCFKKTEVKTLHDQMILDNIFEEIRTSSIAQANLLNIVQDKTPKILWVLLILVSTIFIGCFFFFGFENQFLATAVVTLISVLVGLVIALIYDMDTPLQVGFWNTSPRPYLDLKKFIVKKE